jgi:hypothetical protein
LSRFRSIASLNIALAKALMCFKVFFPCLVLRLERKAGRSNFLGVVSKPI